MAAPDSFHTITHFAFHDNVTVASDKKTYGLVALLPDECTWRFFSGSIYYVMHEYRTIMDALTEASEENSGNEEYNVIFYELDDNENPVGVITSLSLTAEQNRKMGNGFHPVIIRDLTIVNKVDVTPFNLAF